ncbi:MULTISPECIES: AMP-binding protein [unclassified Variovorax]|uniref:class I adenylate-forming enzyme family protein n=1 Tax=unclassified Variovorax TaxID=663243 RepID=UPI00076CE862|nr:MULTISPECIES: AMP-binding protein [unclassified Variovorax]KWT95817.1 Long-chain-fatty-acid--CoA ligase [Variovorax sp. WDL1]PNG58849.1 Long-chain-fatty-acid--CoA ligase FadD13 [Variovorax sp. B4]PNG61361.1 Long-chain-fatty-acid--CoA ligase FadD13 [Variovorax sp. B2]VTV12640.1 Long-chain-fatty-acid--CoA ligase FadD13 [Variovorax sp. WDL1]
MLTGDMLRRSAHRFPDKPAIVLRGPKGSERVPYSELDALADRVAHAVLGLGLPRGATVSMLCRNLPAYGAVFFGVARSGCVLNNISILYAPEELGYVLAKSDTRVLIYDAQFADKVAAVRESCPEIRHFVAIGGSDSGNAEVPGAIAFERFIDGHPSTPPEVAIDERDPFCMTYTGGTTGHPKGVLMNHRARAITAHTVVVEEHLEASDVVAIVTPLFHVAALNIMFQPAILVGATTVFVTPWSPQAYIDAVEAERITATFMVPTQANALAMLPDLEQRQLQSWTKLSFAGAPMPDWVQVELMRKLPQLRLTQIYGQSEMGVIAALPWQRARDKLGSVGRQPYNVDVAVLRPDGTPAAAGELGEVASRGDNLMIGYYGEPQQTAEFFRLGNGWGLSGDIGVMDAEGFVTLIDRAKDMLISGGENVYPKEIEQVLYELPEVAECAVFGIPDARWGEVPAAYVQLKPGCTLDEARVVAQCEQKLARHKRPRLVRFVEGFPKTPIGKIQKNLLKEPYWAGRKKI